MTEERTDALGRRVWDTAHYEEQARKRAYELDAAAIADDGSASAKRSKKEAPVERRPLEQRNEELKLDVNLGKRVAVTPFTPKPQQGGYWCNTCECLLKDSKAWLDHLNGKRHNRLLGMSMQVAKSTLEGVKAKLGALAKQREAAQTAAPAEGNDSVAQRLALAEQERKKKKKERKERKKAKKNVQKTEDEGQEAEDPQATEEAKMLAKFLAS